MRFEEEEFPRMGGEVNSFGGVDVVVGGSGGNLFFVTV